MNLRVKIASPLKETKGKVPQEFGSSRYCKSEQNYQSYY